MGIFVDIKPAVNEFENILELQNAIIGVMESDYSMALFEASDIKSSLNTLKNFIIKFYTYVKNVLLNLIKFVQSYFYKGEEFVNKYGKIIAEKDGSKFIMLGRFFVISRGDKKVASVLHEIQHFKDEINEKLKDPMFVKNHNIEDMMKILKSNIGSAPIRDFFEALHNKGFGMTSSDARSKIIEEIEKAYSELGPEGPIGAGRDLSNQYKMEMLDTIKNFNKHSKELNDLKNHLMEEERKLIDDVSDIDEHNHDDFNIFKVKFNLFKELTSLSIAAVSTSIRTRAEGYKEYIKTLRLFIAYEPISKYRTAKKEEKEE